MPSVYIVILDPAPINFPQSWRVLDNVFGDCPEGPIESDNFIYIPKVEFEEECPTVTVISGEAEAECNVYKVEEDELPENFPTP